MLPKELNICGFKYKIIEENEPFIMDNSVVDGLHDEGTTEIKIVTGKYSKNYIYSCLVHETIHAINKLILNGSLDEHKINTLANGLTSVLMNNPDFIKLFTEAEQKGNITNAV